MDDEFLDNEFFMKLIRLGVQAPELRNASRQILQRLHKERQAGEAGTDDEERRTAMLQAEFQDNRE